MAIISVLHISDLHYQHGNEDQLEFISTFLADIQKEKRTHQCKFVVFSGDLVVTPSLENYSSVKEHFIEPLMDILNLPMDYFFFVPGNHDIDRDDIELTQDSDSWLVAAISEYFGSKRKQYSDKVEKAKRHFKHKYKDYIAFHNGLYSGKETSTVKHMLNEYNAAHVYTYSNSKIGVACINSTLTCFGSSNAEIGKIYIGREQLEGIYRQIKDCSIRIAVFHHPLEGTDIFSHDEVKNYLFENFQVILTGHTHTERSYSMAQNNEKLFYNISSCLFSEDYKKETIYDPAYSFIQIDCDDLKVKAFYRKYYAMRNEFDVDLRFFDNGCNSYSLRKPNHIINQIAEKPFINLHKPKLIESVTGSFQNLDEESSGYNVQYRGQTFEDQYLSDTDFSMYSFRSSRFRGCTFKSCLFTNTILINSSFEDCNFVDTKFISIDHFYTVEYCEKANMVAVAGEGGVVVILKLIFPDDNQEEYHFITKKVLYGVEGKIRSLSWRDNGDYIVAGDQMGCLYIWAVNNPEPVYKKQVGNNPIYAVSWSPDGNQITSTDESGHRIYVYRFKISSEGITVYNVVTLYDSNHKDRHYQQILDCAWSSDGRWLATFGIDRNICIWDMRNISDDNLCPKLYTKSHIHSDYIRKMIWGSDSRCFVTCSDDGVIKRWGFDCDNTMAIIPKQEICVKPGEGNNEVLSMVWYSEKTIFAGLRDDDYAIIDGMDSCPVVVKTEKAHKGRIWDMAIDRRNKIVFTVGNGTITSWRYIPERNNMIRLCSYESKLLCTGMKFMKCSGLNSGTYLVSKNKDIPEKCEQGSLLDFLLTKGASVYQDD